MASFGSSAGKKGLMLSALLLLQACSGDAPPAAESVVAQATSGPAAAELSAALHTAMGGKAALQAVQVLVMQGSGVRNHLGQIGVTGGDDPEATLSDHIETIDFVNGHAAIDNQVTAGEGFAQHRTEAYTTWKGQRLGWGTTEGRPNIVTSTNGLFSWASHNSPDILLRRNPITIALAAANATGAATEMTLEGQSYWYLPTTLDGETLGLYIDKQSSLLHAFTALDTETMRGDKDALYIYSDYRQTGPLQLPYSVQIRHGGTLFTRLQYDSITLDDQSALAIFEIPPEVTDQADQVVALNGDAWVPLEWVEVAEGVIHIVAFSHHSMVVEFPNFVAVVEGPYTEGQSLTLARMIEERIGKPIRYVVPSHPHYDHTGGLRGLASTGASILTAAGHEDEIRMIIESTHSNPPDTLAQHVIDGAEVGAVEVFSGKTDITEGEQSLLLFEVATIPHVNPKVLAFVLSSGVLFQSDLFFGGPGPDAKALYEAIIELGLPVQQIVGGHGGVLPFAALETAVNGSN